MSPHQQGRGTKMREHCYGGIDVSKDRLDVMVLPDSKSFSVDNNAAGYTSWLNDCLACRSPQLASSRVAATSVPLSEPCWRRACRCDASTPTSCASSPAPVACSPRTTGSMPG